jgi:hypothetical protein
MANDPNREPDGVTNQVRFCEGGGTYRQGFPPLLSTFAQGTGNDLTPKNVFAPLRLSAGLGGGVCCCQAGDHALPEAADASADDVGVHGPLRHRLSGELGPRVRVAWLVEGEDACEAAAGRVAPSERLAEIPRLVQGGDQRCVPVLLVEHRARLDSGRDDDRRDAVTGAVEGEPELTSRRGGVGWGRGAGWHVVVGPAWLVPPDEQGGVPDVRAGLRGR